MFAFGVFDRAAYADDDAQVPVAEHAAGAREVTTLLENRGRVLPLRPRKVKRLALIGSDADRFKSGGARRTSRP